jgi:hypothetical protein
VYDEVGAEGNRLAEVPGRGRMRKKKKKKKKKKKEGGDRGRSVH